MSSTNDDAAVVVNKKKRPVAAAADDEEDMNAMNGLDNEMELIAPGVALNGQQPRRRPNRLQYNERRKIRKRLERQEDEGPSSQGHESTDLLRGSKVSVEEKVIQRSLVFGSQTSTKVAAEAAEDEDEESVDDGADKQDDESDDLNYAEDDHSDAEEEINKKTPAKNGRGGKARPASSGRSRKRSRNQRMKTFRSAKMAERHGEALSAHIRGKPALAIRKLKQLASLVPSAPQVYSSLGMIYRDLFLESLEKENGEDIDDDDDNDTSRTPGDRRVHFASDVRQTYNDLFKDQGALFKEQLEYAKKAYGSYHIAACLCKRDAGMWEKSGDAALDIAALHSKVLAYTKLGNTVCEFHSAEKQRWLEEAKNDLQSAVGLNPPGIFLPAKLAQVMIDLGLLSDALTLLTDLKEKRAFDSSYDGWQLYADLMLRIGYECKLWNDGIQTNDAYMFRRWLRKHSQTFDWEERRAQALVKALEAACGSNNCNGLLKWMQDRATSQNKETPMSETIEDGTNEDAVLLARSNEGELAAFDKTTMEMELLADSLEANERQQARDSIVARQKAPHGTASNQSDRPGSDEIAQEVFPKQRVSASIRTVCRIGSELIHSLLRLDLHNGGRLAGDAVSSYLIERLKERNLRHAQAPVASTETSTALYAMGHKDYDEGTKMESVDNDSVASFSDEEDLEMRTDEELRNLEKGVLPPDVRFLYGLSMAKEGNAVLASHCLKALAELPVESVDWLKDDSPYSNTTADPEWVKHEADFKGPYGRSSALAFVSDILSDLQLKEILKKTGPLYQQHVAILQESGLIDAALSSGSLKPRFVLRRGLIVKIMMTDLFQRLVVITEEADADNQESMVESLVNAFESITFILTAIWKPNHNDVISMTVVDLITALQRTVIFGMKYLASHGKDAKQKDALKLTKTLAKPVGLLCGLPDLTLDKRIVNDNSLELKTFPMKSAWVSTYLWPIALRAFNLCVATNVSQFSGWEKDEFSLRLLRQGTHTSSFFGITMDAGHIAGYLTEVIENELAQQWQLIQDRVSTNFAFDEKLRDLRDTAWYKKVKERHHGAEAKHQIVHEAEDKAISSFLGFSRLCLEAFDGSAETENLLYVSLSILLPLSQFVLNECLWDMPIGRATSKPSSFKGWNAISASAENAQPPPSRRPGYVRKCKRIQGASTTNEAAALDGFFHWENDQNVLLNSTNVSLSVLLDEWTQAMTKRPKVSASTEKLMKELDVELTNMRLCYSVRSSSKASLKIAVVLMKLVSSRECHNPFLCLQHAALFASQAPKLGTNDQHFHGALPRVELCTELEAINIIGRADCLRALLFYQEAAFLCSFVAQVVTERRKTEQSWTSRWRVVGVLAYDLSINIRNIISIMKSQGDSKINVDDFRWKASVINEFESARNDALVLAGDPTGSAYPGETDQETADIGINESGQRHEHCADEFENIEIQAI